MNTNEIFNNKDTIVDLKKAYDVFDWVYYSEYYNSVSKQNFTNKLSAWNYLYESNTKENVLFFTLAKKETITFDNFDWISYISINEDLTELNRKEAWDHWINYGIKEDRGIRRINTSCIHKARFGNLFFINMAFHFIAIKNNLNVSYKYHDKFIDLGIRFYIGKKTYKEVLLLTDANFFDIIKSDVKLEKNITIDIDHFFCQIPEFCLFIKEQFNDIFKENIVKKNFFKSRYSNNEDVFIHVRLGDLKNDLSFDDNRNYYDKLLTDLSFKNGYISSDSIENDLCKFLIQKYNLSVINYDEIKTIMFASTCDKIILSGGTFSWLIGFLSFYSKKIYYPKYKNTWYDDIFIFKEWIAVEV
jgi:hypothetical protein